MPPPKLTIGMAVYNDFDGVYFTLQSLRLHHAEAMADCELIVVDNAPDAPGGAQMLEPLLANAAVGSAGAKYIRMPGSTGTTQPRNAVFAHASGAAVLCMDSHVLLAPGAIARLIEFYDQQPETPDLYSGPLIFDDLRNAVTHFDDVWRAEMWGIWARAWTCPCAHDVAESVTIPGVDQEASELSPVPLRGKALLFSVREAAGGKAEYCALKPGTIPVSLCGRCGRKLPQELPFAGHERALEKLGYQTLDSIEDAEPFEIPGMGLGLFSCRRSAWLGFNEHFRGFGAEEMYIHEKYRQAGRRCLCLPWLKWDHRFGRPNGVSYPLTRYNKLRNYVLGHVELGLDLAPVKAHFVDSGLVPPAEWDFLLSDPVGHTQEVTHAKFVAQPVASAQQNPSGRPLPPDDVQTPEALLTWCGGIKRDLEEHLPRLAELAGQVNHVTEFSARRESTIGLLGGKPERLVSYNVENDLILAQLPARFPWVSVEAKTSREVPSIEPTDLLFLDSEHTYARLSAELAAYAPSVQRWIVLHDTQVHAETGEDGGRGLVPAIQDFLANHPEWFVYSHTQQQYGLTVLGRRPEDKPPHKIHLAPPGYGPGTELKAMLAQLGITENPACDCNAKALQMDFWGVDGCRMPQPADQEMFGEKVLAGTPRFDVIVGWMKAGYERWGWADRIKAAAAAVATGLAFKLCITDPFPGLIEEAIRRAEEKEAAAD